MPLHRSVKERPNPKISATALAEYLIGLPAAQESVLQNSRWVQPSVVVPYAGAMRALRSYNADPHRPREILRRVKEDLSATAENTDRKWPKAEALRCREAIELFEVAENALGLRGLPLSAPPRFEAMMINGVSLSVHPDLLVRVDSPKGPRIGAVMIRLAKTPDPSDCKMEAKALQRQEHRIETARYIVAMMQMVLEDQAGHLGTVDRDILFVADVRLKARIGAAVDHSARLDSISAACDQIRRLWATLEPKPSMKRKLAGD